MVLQCLQRLSAAPECIDTLLALPNLGSRLWAVYACGDEGIAAEVAKLFLRWWSPHTSRRGTGTPLQAAGAGLVCFSKQIAAFSSKWVQR